jgi:thioesterase domain-containing protein/acyl carrier protein
MYGPTETTIWSTCRRITDAARVDIGGPIDNTEVLILDDRGQPQPIGVPGELFIGGDGLARGYLDRPVLTAERFTPHPLKTGARLYRTGDRARWLADGSIGFLGRADQQIKVRGLRVELGEIEATLRTHAAIREAVVILREDTPGDQRLVAYVSGALPTATIAPADLRAHLKGSLPDYMIPSAFVTVEAWPLTPNGKLDRRALPKPESDRAAGDVARIPPRTPTEQRLAGIWREVLGVTTIGARDDFFLIGGHSLLAIRLMQRVHQTFNVSLPPGALFQHPTLADLASRIDAELPQEVLVRMIEGGDGTPFFWLHGIGGEVFSYMQISKHLARSRPVYGFTGDWTQITRSPKAEGLTLEAMAAHYVRELRAAHPSGPYHLGGYCGAAMLVVEMARQLERAGQEVGVLAVLDYYIAPSYPAMSPVQQMGAFLRNLPYWLLEDAKPSGFKDLNGRLRSGLRRFWQRMSNGQNNGAAPSAPARELDVRDRLGMWGFPDHQVGMLAAHHRVIGDYQPKPIEARVTLFMPRAYRLLGPWPTGHDPEWNRLARGGVDLHHVRGSHSTMMVEPFAADLAARLNASIETCEQRRQARRSSAAVAPAPRVGDQRVRVMSQIASIIG